MNALAHKKSVDLLQHRHDWWRDFLSTSHLLDPRTYRSRRAVNEPPECMKFDTTQNGPFHLAASHNVAQATFPSDEKIWHAWYVISGRADEIELCTLVPSQQQLISLPRRTALSACCRRCTAPAQYWSRDPTHLIGFCFLQRCHPGLQPSPFVQFLFDVLPADLNGIMVKSKQNNLAPSTSGGCMRCVKPGRRRDATNLFDDPWYCRMDP